MAKYVFLLISAVIVFVIASEMRIERDRIPTKSEKMVELLENYAFSAPKVVEVLLDEEIDNKKTREKVKVIIIRTDTEYLPKAQRVPDKAENVMDILSARLPGNDFGTPLSENASFFRMLTSNSDWAVSTIETTRGHFSLWKRVTDINFASSLE